MNVKKIKSICADCDTRKNVIFDISKDMYDDEFEFELNCIIWNDITFYGVPFDLSDTESNNIYEGKYNKAIKIGQINGCLILCKQMINRGYDPWEMCDDSDGDLEYTISSLKDEGGPLNWDSGDPEQDVYYIHEFKMETGYDDVKLKSRIIEKLPDLIFSFLHVDPDILAFYPETLEYTQDEEITKKHMLLKSIAADKMDLFHESITGERTLEVNEENVVNIKSIYQLTEDEINIIMRRRNSDSSYPEQAKDKKEFAFYKKNGFKEAGDSRLLFKDIYEEYI